MKVHIKPTFRGEDEGDGGVRRVIEMQLRTFPGVGLEIVETEEEADLIVVHIRETKEWFRRYATDKPVVIDCHGVYWSEYEWLNWCYVANRDVMESIREADAVIAHSEWVAQAIRRHTMRQVYVVNHGMDLEFWEVPEEHLDYILWNKNRPDPVCDPRPVVELAKRLPERQFVSTFGIDEDRLENIKVTGVLPYAEALHFVNQAGVYLCTTRETFGVGTLEAMASGVPVVGWNWGGQREFITHKETGWLSEPNDYDALVEGIEWAFTNREELSRKSREVAEQFDEREKAKEYAIALNEVYNRWKERRSGPRTSIVVTAYDLERYLPNCLDSILKQRDENWECIIVDDASPDRSGEIAEIYAGEDSRFRVIHNEKNQYLSGARNTGIAEARGRYILPLDADDMISPLTTELLAKALDEDPSIHVAYGNVLFVDEDGKTPTEYNTHGQTKGHSGWPVDFKYEWQEMGRNCLPYASMFRHEAWELTGGYRRRCRTAEDADFWMRLSSYGFRPKRVTLADTLIYRNREGSMSREVGYRDWAAWFPWHEDEGVRPGGAAANTQPPIHSCDPTVISVIIPVGPGHEELVWDAIDSVDAQTMRQWECIVVNDTGAPLRMLPSWVRVIDTPGKIGVAAARNLGVKAARSLLFLPLDADDYLQPACLKAMFGAWQTEQGGIVYSNWYEEFDKEERKIFEAEDFDPATIMHYTRTVGALHAVTALYPRQLWLDVGGFDEELPAWEDWEFQIAAWSKGYCSVRIAEPLWVYRKNTGSRREENYRQFDEGKEGIISKWGKFFRGGESFMACSSCSKKKYSLAQQTQSSMSHSQATADGAVLIEYTGSAQGTRRIKGPTGTTYAFGGGKNRQKYVREEDASFFLTLVDFIVAPVNEPVVTTPELVAEGPPPK